MPNQKVEFIGRKKELKTLLDATKAWNTQQILFVYGEPGVGKTSIVRELRRMLTSEAKYSPSSNNHTNWIFNVDLDDPRVQWPAGISFSIIGKIEQDAAFKEYIIKYQKMQEEIQSTQSPQLELEREIDEMFISRYREIAKNTRTIILCDTTDAAKTKIARKSIDYLIQLCNQISNVVVVFSGVDAKTLLDNIEARIERKVVQYAPVPIEPLSYEDGLKYLRRKQELLHIVIEPEIEKRILTIAGGIPFLIDLAAEGRARGFLLQLDPQFSANSISDADIVKRREDFESDLVRYIVQLRRPLDRLALILSWIHPVDAKFCARLLDISESRANELLADARDNVSFIKPLPGDRIKLHDLMEHLVQKYVLEKLGGERKKRYSLRAALYLRERAEEMKSSYGILHEKLNKSGSEYLREEILLLEYWQTIIQLFRYALVADIDLAAYAYRDLADMRKKRAETPIKEEIPELVRQLMKQRKKLDSETGFQASIEYVEFLTEDGKYTDAMSLLHEIAGDERLSPEQRITVLLKQGNVNVRVRETGVQDAGLKEFLEALRIADEHKIQDEHLSQAETEVGWIYSSRGDWEEAKKHFTSALESALEKGSQESIATVLNELAYIEFNENPISAISTCQRSIDIWIELSDKFGLGRAYSNMGTLYYRSGEFKEAQKYFQKSIDIFEVAQITEWIGILSSWQGATYCSQAELDVEDPAASEMLKKAEYLLKRAMEIGPVMDRARNHNRLGRVYRTQKRYDEAYQELLNSYQSSLEIPDFIYEIATLRDLSLLALESERFDMYPDLKEKLSNYEARGLTKFSHAYGGALTNLGIISVYLGDLDYGFLKIANGLKSSVMLGGYGNHSISKTLNKFYYYAERYIPPSDLRELKEDLISFWKHEKLDLSCPEALVIFYKL